MERLDKIFDHMDRVLIFMAGCFLVGLIMLTCANVFFRLFWKPILGTFELIRYSVAIV
ncbi:MAG: TRAP transporter small permease, partial [Deltaproteobacteria bacterium]|nr:TRAP transporter small permease [Deltaproteobacteria bacterium]